MSLESTSVIAGLVATNPTAGDPKSQGDDHLRMIKTVLQQCLNGFTGAILLFGTEVGTAVAHVLTPTIPLLSYTPGLMLLYRPANAGTGALTVNVSTLGAKSVKTLLGADPTSGDIVASQPLLLMYDGTNFVIIAGSEQLQRTGNQTVTGTWTWTGNIIQTGDHSVSGTLSGPSMTAKGNVAGQVWTGTQDFTGSNITVPAPVVGASPATKTYADGLAFAAALPAQSAATVGMVPISGQTTVGVAEWGDVSSVGGDIFLYNNY